MLFNTLVQIINQAANEQIAADKLYFTACGGAVLVTLETVGEEGEPTGMLAQKRLTSAEVQTGGQPTLVQWDRPVLQKAGERYAICVACADETTALQIAQIGEASAAGGQVTAAQAAVGPVLHINPSGLVTSYANRMLRFERMAVAYTTAQQTVTVGQVSVADATALAVNAGAEQPAADAGIRYAIELVDVGGAVLQSFDVDSGQPVRLLAPYSGAVRVKATLRVGANGMGAVLQPGSTLVAGKLHATGTYVTPAFLLNGGDDLRVIYEADIPAGAAVAVHAQIDGDVTWQAVPYDSSTNAAGIVQVSHRLDPMAGTGQALRLLLTLTGNTNARPRLANLRAAVL